MVEIQILALSVRDACAAIGCGRTTLYSLIADGKIVARSLGSRTIIPTESLREFLGSLPPAPIHIRSSSNALIEEAREP